MILLRSLATQMDFRENADLQEFSKNLHLVILPSTLWAIHIDPEYQFVAILHVQVKSPLKMDIDKGIIVTFDCTHNLINASFLIHNEIVNIPALSSYIKAISDLSHLIYVIHNLKICPNADKKTEYLQCNKYIELNKYDTFCSSCIWIDKKDKSSNIWKDLNYVQELHCNNSESSDEIVTDNLMEENLCCSKNDSELINNTRLSECNDSNLHNIKKEISEFENIQIKENSNLSEKVQKRKRNSRSFPCEFCKKVFFTKAHLTEHLRSHTGEKPFLCEICNKASSRRSVHQRHVLTHSNSKPNLCNVCGKTFCQGYRMKDHLLTHSSERPFKCEICHKAFAKSYNLKMHKKTHSGARSFVCSTCGKTYTTQSNLTTHVRSAHTNKKPHACTNCHMSFVHPRHLRIHMRKHTGEKPYKCVICGKTFAKNIHLTIHTRTHTGEKPHICTICGKGFTTTGNLSSHKRVHHKDLNIEAIK